MFGKDMESVPLTIDTIAFQKVYSEVGETALVDLKYEDGDEKVLIKEVQVHPVTGNPLHAGFYKVNLKEKITAEIPVEVVGEENNPLIKSGSGILLMIMNTVEVECLPSDLPQNFEVDVAHLEEIGDGITISELKYDKDKIELMGEFEDDELILKITYAEMEEEEEEVDEAAAIEGMEATEEGAEEEGSDGETEAASETSAEEKSEE